MLLVHVRVHRQQLHGGDAERLEVLDGGLGGEPEVGAAQVLRDGGMALVKPRTCSS